jgi:ferredoxin
LGGVFPAPMGETRNTFPGGVWLSTNWPRQFPAPTIFPTPSTLYVPILPPGSGEAAAKPAGTAVERGESLLRASPESGAFALAPHPGKIAGKTPITLSDGRGATAVELLVSPAEIADGAQPVPSGDEIEKELPELPAVTNPASDLPHWTSLFRRCGLYVDRRTSPDLMHQLTQAAYRPVDTVICSLLDQDPTLRLNALLAYRHAATICAALHLLSKLLSASRTLLAVDGSTPGVFRRPLMNLAKQLKLKVVALPARYPQADPTLLLHTLTDRGLRVGRSPVEKGVVLLDAAAAVAVGQCFLRQQPMVEAPVAIRDRIKAESHYLWAPLGTPVSTILESIGSQTGAVELLAGDALRKVAVESDAVLGATENVLHVAPAATAASGPCVRCSWCADRCPTGVQPAWLLEAAQQRDPELATRAGIDSCIACGICDYVCPSNLPLVESIRTLKRAG